MICIPKIRRISGVDHFIDRLKYLKLFGRDLSCVMLSYGWVGIGIFWSKQRSEEDGA